MVNLQAINTFSRHHKGSLAYRLFSYFAVILLLILGAQNAAEHALVKTLLQVPTKVQKEMLDLAIQAEVMLGEGDMDELADWEKAQDYYLFVLDKDRNVLSGRKMHPHFEFKLNFIRKLDSILDSQVNQPIIAVPLNNQNQLVIQFPHEKHPAHQFRYYFAISQVVIAVLILTVFSWLLARYLQKPLTQLQEASRRLAEGDFSVRVGNEVGDGVREFSELAKDFDHMTQRIYDLAEKQRRLIRDVSHELKTPLARHSLALHLLRRHLTEDQQAMADKLERESEEMNDLVSEILEFSRLENASYAPELVPLQLETLCSLHTLESQYGKGDGQTILCQVPKGLPLVMADNRLTSRVIKNLLSNAMKYAGEKATITISAYEFGEYINVEVTDNGRGIPKQHLKHIFNAFTRIEEARDKKSGGTGLGLAIVKEAMIVMNGKVKAENCQPSGLRITLSFPAYR
ncbi:two-component sensor histidine kinase [Photobacterium jeanii]|uniref:histidine kinase n=1 Tax=Photobacterium jeanii TaxID=858640 RepID=A0A178K6K5_9GAMM|nr:sensor histidine kinase [Photobacterium jeanii]OAN12969.1 two-component sensor histidine kinase [Photobacterium jeanii]PST89117.1 sensor histidine kinase [Photobacterium jeanii]